MKQPIPPHVLALLRDGSPDALEVAGDWFEENGLDPETIRHFRRDRIVLAMACIELNRGDSSWLVVNGKLTPVDGFSIRRESTRENHVVKSLGGEVVGYARPYMPGPTRYFVTIQARQPLSVSRPQDWFAKGSDTDFTDLMVPLSGTSAVCLRAFEDTRVRSVDGYGYGPRVSFRYDVQGVEAFQVIVEANGRVEVFSRFSR